MSAGGGDRDVTFRAAFEGGEAVEGLKSVETGVESLKTEIKTVPAAASELDEAMTRAAAAVARLSDPKLSPIALQRAVLQADIATEGLAEAMKKAAATGGPTPPEMTAKVKQFETAVTAANTRAGALRDRMGDLRSQGNLASTSIETLAGKLGSAQSALQEAANSSNKMVEGLAKAGLAAFAVVEGFKLLDQAAQQVVAGAKMLGDAYVAHVEKSARATTAAYTHELALRAVEKGLIAAGGSALELDKRFESLISGTNRAAKELQDFANGAGVKVPESFFKLQQAAFGMETTLALAFTRGKAAFLDWASTNEARLKQIEAEYNRHGVRVPEYIAKAIAALKREGEQIALNTKLVEDQKNALENLVKSKAAEQTANYKVADSIKAVVAEAAKAITAAEDSISAARHSAEEKIRALKQEEISQEEFNTRKRAILSEMDAAIAAASDDEVAARAKAEEANRKLASQYGLTSGQMKNALEDAKNLTRGTDAARDADEGLKNMAGKLAEALAEQEKIWGNSKTEAEKWASAIEVVAKRTEAPKETITKFGEAFFKIGEDAKNVDKNGNLAATAIEKIGTVSIIAQGRLAALRGEIAYLNTAIDNLDKKTKNAADGGGGGGSDLGGDITGGKLGESSD